MELSTKKVNLLLAFLFVLDCVLSTVAYFFPGFWFWVFHGVEFSDPQGFLRRAGASWLAFAIIQGLAWRKWRADPAWLLLVAGVRLSDTLTDWTYLAFAHDRTWFAWASLLITGPANFCFGVYLIKAFQHVDKLRQRA